MVLLRRRSRLLRQPRRHHCMMARRSQTKARSFPSSARIICEPVLVRCGSQDSGSIREGLLGQSLSQYLDAPVEMRTLELNLGRTGASGEDPNLANLPAGSPILAKNAR